MIRFVIGLFILLGAVGREDFYLECVQAADCVADAPNFGVSSVSYTHLTLPTKRIV